MLSPSSIDGFSPSRRHLLASFLSRFSLFLPAFELPPPDTPIFAFSLQRAGHFSLLLLIAACLKPIFSRHAIICVRESGWPRIAVHIQRAFLEPRRALSSYATISRRKSVAYRLIATLGLQRKEARTRHATTPRGAPLFSRPKFYSILCHSPSRAWQHQRMPRLRSSRRLDDFLSDGFFASQLFATAGGHIVIAMRWIWPTTALSGCHYYKNTPSPELERWRRLARAARREILIFRRRRGGAAPSMPCADDAAGATRAGDGRRRGISEDIIIDFCAPSTKR